MDAEAGRQDPEGGPRGIVDAHHSGHDADYNTRLVVEPDERNLHPLTYGAATSPDGLRIAESRHGLGVSMTWLALAAVVIAVVAVVAAVLKRGRAGGPQPLEFVPISASRPSLPVFDPAAGGVPPLFTNDPEFEARARPTPPDAICFLTGRIVATCTCAKHVSQGAKQ